MTMTNVSIRQFVILCLIFPLWGLGGLLAQATAQTDTARISSQSVISPPSGEPTVFRPQGEKLGGFAIGASADMKNSTAVDLGNFRAPMAYAPNADISYNKIFGGTGDDYSNDFGGYLYDRDIKIAPDGTIWICGSTDSSDGDLAAAGNKGGIDAWLLHINPATNQILYNRTFGGSGNDEFTKMILMPDGTIWVCGQTNSSDGDLSVVPTKGKYDGWLMHIDPVTNQILYNRCIGGQYDDWFYNMIIDSNNVIWLSGETLSADQDNLNADFSGGNQFSDAWLVGVNSTQNASAALKYNRCFGGARPEGFFDLQEMSDGTLWVAGGTMSNDGLPGSSGFHGAKGIRDGWLLHIDPTQSALAAQVLYSRCFGGSNGELICSINVIDPNNVWFCSSASSTDGNLTGITTHGSNDLWLACVNTNTNTLTYNHCFGGLNSDGSNYPEFAVVSDGTIWIATQSSSTDGDLASAGNHGSTDIWIFNFDPATNQLKYNKCFGGSADEIMPAIALDETKKQVWVSCGTSSNNDGDVPATHGGRDLWLFSINYGTTGIDNVLADKINIYPNPVRDELFIDIPFFEKMEYLKNVEICDLSGRTVGALRATPLQAGNANINVQSLPSGVYFIKITTDKGIVTKKFIKQ